MKRCHVSALFWALLLVSLSVPSDAFLIDDLTKGLGFSDAIGNSLDDPTIVMGLKEALATGTTRAVKLVAQRDGYFDNSMIKILMPEKVRSVTNLLSKFGF